MECKHENQFSDEVRGDLVCKDCGEVVSRLYTQSIYKINPEDDSKIGRQFVALGDRLNIVDGLGSYMGFQFSNYFHDKNGVPLSAKKQSLFRRLKYRYDLRARIAKHETAFRTLTELNRILNMLQLGQDMKSRIAYLYQKIVKKIDRTEINNNHLNLVGVCIYLASKENKYNCHLTLKEIAASFQSFNHRVTMKSIIATALKLKVHCPTEFESHRPLKAEDYLGKVVTQVVGEITVKERLALLKRDSFQYEQLLMQYSQAVLTRLPIAYRGARNPHILAVATIYAADNQIAKLWSEKPILTQTILADITNTAPYSIRDHWRYMFKLGITDEPAA
jgi:transcription initiation factor TFIIIB Brf1 subunit/transcription initiation factor TFIIB